MSLPLPRILAALCLGLFAVACSHPVAHTTTDAGSKADAGPVVVDAGPKPPAAIGGGCQQDSDCTSGKCNTQPSGGYCVQDCQDNRDCPDGSACAQVGQGQTTCLAECKGDADCRSGYTCSPGADICVPGKPCQSSNDCSNGQSCDTTTGICAGIFTKTNTIGGLCQGDSDCTVGRHPTCITEDDGFTGGYCSSFCRSDASCGGKNPCVLGLVSDSPNFGLCMESCSMNSDCRDQYNCITRNGQSFCMAFCHADSDCIDPGQTCDTKSGLCSGGTPPDAGTPDAGSMDMDAGTPDDAGMPDMDGGAGDVDAGPSGYDGGYPAPRPDAPQVSTGGGPVLKSPKFVPVFFANDDATQVAALKDFIAHVGSTDYWKAIGAEYGVGPATALPPVDLPEIATGTLLDDSIQVWLDDHITSGALPKPDENTLYVLHYPAAMTILLDGSRSCQLFGGYHSDAALSDGSHVAYAVIPHCDDPGGSSPLDVETGTESHELIEASTDPYPMTNPAYTQVDEGHIEWSFALGGSEVGDMCAQNRDAFTKFAELPYVVQRSWSNAAAAAGKDPCVPPLPGEVFFNAAPELNDDIAVSLMGQRATMKGVKLAPGTTRTVSLDLWSEADTGGPWDVSVQDFGSLTGGQGGFTYTVGGSSGVNGDKLNLVITANSSAGQVGMFFVVSKLGSASHFWVGLAGN